VSTTAKPDPRLGRERDFHNQWARSIGLDDLLVRESFEAPTAIENRYALSEFGDLKGKKLLDLGCGAGETSVYFALRGAEVYACDLGEEFLELARSLADKFDVKLQLAQVDARSLPYESDCFDFVFGNGILHHVELVPAAKEIRRVLKSGGKAVFVEPLPYNPLINVYRAMAKGVRTEDERPLRFRDLNRMKLLFASFHHREFWLFTLSIFLHFFFVKRWHPSQVRYWKKVIEVGESYKRVFGVLERLDEFFLRWVPFLNFLCWNTVVVVRK